MARAGELTLDTSDQVQTASILLRPYGIDVACAREGSGREVVITRTLPRPDAEYRQVLTDLGPDGTYGPRLKTSYRDGELRVQVYDAAPLRPVVEIVARPGSEGITVTVLEGSVFPRVVLGQR